MIFSGPGGWRGRRACPFLAVSRRDLCRSDLRRKRPAVYLAGLHAPGTLGAAQYVVGNLGKLYRDLKTRRFSTIVRYEFEPTSQLTMRSVEPVTPLYRHEGS
jgi:hypothetical protein